MAWLAVPKSTDQAKQTDSNQTIRSDGSNRDSGPKVREVVKRDPDNCKNLLFGATCSRLPSIFY